VLLVFAISIAGEETLPRPDSNWKRNLRRISLVIVLLLLLWIVLPLPKTTVVGGDAAEFSKALWQDRAVDVLIQIVIIFSAVFKPVRVIGRSEVACCPPTTSHATTRNLETMEDAPVLEMEKELV